MSLVEFEPSDIERLLDLLNQRLRRRRLRASIYVVGGAAIAITVPGASDRRTVDVDAVVSDPAVLEEAEALAQEVFDTRFEQVVGCGKTGNCTDAFLDGFGARAFRRPLTRDEHDRYRALIESVPAAEGGFAEGVKCIESVLTSEPPI